VLPVELLHVPPAAQHAPKVLHLLFAQRSVWEHDLWFGEGGRGLSGDRGREGRRGGGLEGVAWKHSLLRPSTACSLTPRHRLCQAPASIVHPAPPSSLPSPTNKSVPALAALLNPALAAALLARSPEPCAPSASAAALRGSPPPATCRRSWARSTPGCGPSAPPGGTAPRPGEAKEGADGRGLRGRARGRALLQNLRGWCSHCGPGCGPLAISARRAKQRLP
jgi:hypothetical protein